MEWWLSICCKTNYFKFFTTYGFPIDQCTYLLKVYMYVRTKICKFWLFLFLLSILKLTKMIIWFCALTVMSACLIKSNMTWRKYFFTFLIMEESFCSLFYSGDFALENVCTVMVLKCWTAKKIGFHFGHPINKANVLLLLTFHHKILRW